MNFSNEISKTELFTIAPKGKKDKNADAVTDKSIAELISKGVLSKKEAGKLKEAYDLGGIDFGDDGLTKDEIQNFNEDSYKALMRQYNDEKKSTQNYDKLNENFTKNGYDRDKDLNSLQMELSKNKNYIHTDAGKKHFERVYNKMTQPKTEDDKIKETITHIDNEIMEIKQDKKEFNIPKPQLAETEIPEPSQRVNVERDYTSLPIQKQKKIVKKPVVKTETPAAEIIKPLTGGGEPITHVEHGKKSVPIPAAIARNESAAWDVNAYAQNWTKKVMTPFPVAASNTEPAAQGANVVAKETKTTPTIAATPDQTAVKGMDSYAENWAKKVMMPFPSATNSNNSATPVMNIVADSATKTIPPLIKKPTDTVEEAKDLTPSISTPLATKKYYTEPQNTRLISLADLKKDEAGNYLVPAGNYKLDASELPADKAKFTLAKDGNLVIQGDIKTESSYKKAEEYRFVMRKSDAPNREYKQGSFEIDQKGEPLYNGKPIDPKEWDATTNIIQNAYKKDQRGRYLYKGKPISNEEWEKLDKKEKQKLVRGYELVFTKKSTIMRPEDVTDRSLEVTGQGNFYAQNVSIPLDVDCNEFRLGEIRGNIDVALAGKGSIENVSIGTGSCVSIMGNQEAVKITNIQCGTINGENIQLDLLSGGEFLAQGTVSAMKGGTVANSKSKIGHMSGGTVNNAESIACMNGGKIDLYKRGSESSKETVIHNYIAGHVESCDGSTIKIADGLIAGGGITKRGGQIIAGESAPEQNVLATAPTKEKPAFVFGAGIFPLSSY